jgi:4-amino-4-deoxy-L-arabinose transferase-like glycosyltransferase
MAILSPARQLALPWARGWARLYAHVDTLVIGALVALALAIRWPNLLLSPQFPAVGGTILLALDIADGRALPLADDAPYLGAVFIYLLAGVYKLFGPSLEATLIVPWVIGGLTIVPTYLLGREIGGRATGALAAALLATSGAHTVITSHLPLSHSLTPLFATATLWLVARAVVRRDGRALALAGLGAGLTLQTHPTAAPLLAGAAGAALLLCRGWLRTRWPYLALVLVVVGYATLLAHHLQSRFAVVGDVQSKQARYLDADVDSGERAERGVYVNNLEQLLLSVGRLTSGAILDRERDGDFVRDPRVLAYPALALAGFALVARRGGVLLALALLPALLVPPMLSGKYRPILDGRYLMPLVPVAFVGIGLFFARAGYGLAALRSRAAYVGVALLVGLIVPLLAFPLGQLAEFYEESQEDGFGNAGYLRTLDQLRAARAPGEPVLLDEAVRTVKSPGGGNAGASVEWLLAVSRVPVRTWQSDDGLEALVGRLAVLHRSTAAELDESVELTPLDGRSLNGRDGPSYRAYRVGGEVVSGEGR